jgi:predicted nuclease of predicted toxin-antitoxin system
LRGYLLDENLPQHLTLQANAPLISWKDVGAAPTDSDLWDYARKHRLVIVSKDADFSNRITQTQPPPWVVHIRVGNLRFKDFHALIAKAWPEVENLLPSHKLIRVYRDRIEAVRD